MNNIVGSSSNGGYVAPHNILGWNSYKQMVLRLFGSSIDANPVFVLWLSNRINDSGYRY